MRHLTGDSRQQVTLLPDTLNDYVDEDHPVRVIDAFVDTLDMKALYFSKAETQVTGRKPYHPGDLLKLYVYGYLNQTRSTRRLEKECHRNLELLWLMRRLAPDFKTIADFRKDNEKALRGACRAFIQFCRQADLLTGRLVAIDGSKFKAAASKDSVTRRAQLPEQRQRIDHLIGRYLQQLDQVDADDQHIELASASVKEALRQLQQEKTALDKVEVQMDERGRNQACTTEPDASLMRSGREGMVVGYNVQSAVDADSGLIIHHEVTDEGDDRRQLYPMAQQTKTELGQETLDVLADGGYSNGEQSALAVAVKLIVTRWADHHLPPARRHTSTSPPPLDKVVALNPSLFFCVNNTSRAKVDGKNPAKQAKLHTAIGMEPVDKSTIKENYHDKFYVGKYTQADHRHYHMLYGTGLRCGKCRRRRTGSRCPGRGS